jgi:hypothetical protein
MPSGSHGPAFVSQSPLFVGECVLNPVPIAGLETPLGLLPVVEIGHDLEDDSRDVCSRELPDKQCVEIRSPVKQSGVYRGTIVIHNPDDLLSRSLCPLFILILVRRSVTLPDTFLNIVRRSSVGFSRNDCHCM